MIKLLNILLLSGVFEYCGILALLGLAWLLWQKKSRNAGIMMGICYFLPIIVLLYLGHFASKRYIAINIIPALLLTGTFIFSPFIKKYQLHFCLLLVTFIVFTVKDLHFNPYADYLIRTAGVLKKDASLKKHVMLINSTKESERIRHYSGIPSVSLTEHREPAAASGDIPPSVLKTISGNAQKGTTVYLLQKSESSASLLDAEHVNLTQKNDWTFLGAFPVNRKKEKELRLYRAELQKTNDSKTDLKMIRNGDFEETPQNDGFAAASLKYLQKKGCSFFKKPGVVLPAGWRIILAQGLQNCSFEIEQDSRHAISGHGSLRMATVRLKTNNLQIQSEQKIPITKNMPDLFMQVKALVPHTCLAVKACIYDGENLFQTEKILLRMELNDTSVHDYWVVLQNRILSQYADRDCYFLLTFELNRGEVLIDNIGKCS